MTKKIFILLGHPDKETSAGMFADAYQRGAIAGGHEVRRTNIGELSFDPILHKGYKEIQALEPDLVKVQEDIKWADHIVILYPNWWITMPAILKGFFDRAWLPGFAFSFMKDGSNNWKKLLSGRTGRVVITMDNGHFWTHWHFGDYTNEIRKGILEFSGIKPVHLTQISPMKGMSPEKKATWAKKLEVLGLKGK